MIKDHNIAWKNKIINRDFRSMYGNLNGTFEATGGAVNAASSVGASEQTCVLAGAAGDEFYDILTMPYDMDIAYPLRWRIILSEASTDADTPTFTFDYQAKAVGEAMSDITSHESTTFSGDLSTTDDALFASDWVNTESNDYIEAADIMLLTRVTATNLGGASANEIELYALQLQYTVQSTASDGRRHNTNNDPV